MTLFTNETFANKKEKYFQFNGLNIIKLLKQGKDKMSAFLSSDHQAKVIVLIHRQSDPENDYNANNKIVQWRVPVIELIVKHHHG